MIGLAINSLTLIFIIAITFISTPLAGAVLACNPGAYFDGVKCSLCPGGTYGSHPGLKSLQCSGKCAGGYFCPEGSVSARQNICGRSIYYCPPGSASRRLVGDEYYTVVSPRIGINTAKMNKKNTASEQKMCEPGYFCQLGIRYPCPEGTYGEVFGLTSSACSGACPKGFYCPLATPHPIACPPGTFGNGLGLKDSHCSGLCPMGYYCESSTVVPTPCPAGTLGDSMGLTTKACSSHCTQDGHTVCAPSPCPEGFFCPLATAQAIPCGSVSVFCPLGARTPTVASDGYYTMRTSSASAGAVQCSGCDSGSSPRALEDAYLEGNILAALNQTTRTAQKLCEKGAYCIGGIKRLCPAGVYGASEGLATAACSAPCPPGHFCPIGTSDYLKYPCVSKTSFCRQGSVTPTPVDSDYYTILSAPPENLRIDQVICPLGSYCIGGVAYQCPPGTYGGATGLSTSKCSGRCQNGYICPIGSTLATQSPCPAGSYSQNGINCSPCAPGYWCAAGSPSPRQNECGSDSSYCPLGSSSALSVQNGQYAVGQQITTHSSQAVCVVRNVKHLPQCPTRTVGTNSGL